MNKALLLLAILMLPLGLRADQMQDEDVYYAPDVAEDSPEGTTAAAATLPQGAYVSRADLHIFDYSSGRSLSGAELFLGRDYLGRSPLTLKGLVVGPGAELEVRMDGYDEASRPGLRSRYPTMFLLYASNKAKKARMESKSASPPVPAAAKNGNLPAIL